MYANELVERRCVPAGFDVSDYFKVNVLLVSD